MKILFEELPEQLQVAVNEKINYRKENFSDKYSQIVLCEKLQSGEDDPEPIYTCFVEFKHHGMYFTYSTDRQQIDSDYVSYNATIKFLLNSKLIQEKMLSDEGYKLTKIKR